MKGIITTRVSRRRWSQRGVLAPLAVAISLVVAGLAMPALAMGLPAGVGDSDAVRTTAPLAGPFHSDGRFLRDRFGRVVFLHGMNVVWKRAPYLPPSTLLGQDADASRFDERDVRLLAGSGLNAVRLGVMWAGVEPRMGSIDRSYLDRARRIAQLLGEHDIAVLVDSHQDLYTEAYRGEGFPDWARLDHGITPTLCCSFPLAYVGPSVGAAWNDFWANKGQLQTRFRNQWMSVAFAMRGLPNLIGYDLINEPWPGNGWARCMLPGSCRFFDTQRLQTMQEHVAAGIRAVDTRTPLWWEGSTLTSWGVPNQVGALRPLRAPGGNTVLSFHSYCMIGGAVPFISRGADPTCPAVHRRTFDQARLAGVRNSSASVLTEFGASDDLVDIARVAALADARMTSWFYWHYGSWGDPTGVPDSEGMFDVDSDRDTLKQAKADLIVRAYPQTVAGAPLRFSFDPVGSARRFALTYYAAPRITRPTQIVVPVARHYVDGYEVHMTGPARVTSAPNAPLLTLVNTGATGVVRLTVTRRGAPLA